MSGRAASLRWTGSKYSLSSLRTFPASEVLLYASALWSHVARDEGGIDEWASAVWLRDWCCRHGFARFAVNDLGWRRGRLFLCEAAWKSLPSDRSRQLWTSANESMPVARALWLYTRDWRGSMLVEGAVRSLSQSGQAEALLPTPANFNSSTLVCSIVPSTSLQAFVVTLT